MRRSALRKIQFIDHLKRNMVKRYIATTGNYAAGEKLKVEYYAKAGRRTQLIQMAKRISVEMDEHIHRNVLKPQCLALCNEMQKRLPRELRDEVYRFLVHDSTTSIHGFNLLNNSKTKVCKPTDELAQRYTSIEKYGHVDSAAAANERTRSEFATAWFRCTTFESPSFDTLRLFSGVDCRVYGHDVRQLVKAYKVTLHLAIEETLDRRKLLLLEQLREISRLRKGSCVKLLLYSYAKCRYVVECFMAAFPELQALVAKCYTIEIEIME